MGGEEGALGVCPRQLWPALRPGDPVHRLTEEGEAEGDKNSNQPVSQEQELWPLTPSRGRFPGGCGSVRGELGQAGEGVRASRGTARSSPGQRHAAVWKAGSRRRAGEACAHPRLRYEAHRDLCPRVSATAPGPSTLLPTTSCTRPATCAPRPDEVARQLFLPPVSVWVVHHKQRAPNEKQEACRLSFQSRFVFICPIKSP